ncbi:hypothetical protein V6N11_040262 [Hibiscus sabdariffa]|uniref:Protein yippee-like n=1 Tax=Hibiscus sabdariffa TaxID=183260 RepID=A0ABR2RGY4_9ROSI
MDNINVFTYERNARAHFFVCRSCHNPVLPGNDITAVSLSAVIPLPPSFLLLPMFQFLLVFFNYKMSYQTYPMATMDLDINCNVCNVCLGRRSFLLPRDGPEVPDPIMSGRMWSVLRLNQLLYWNGTQMVYADTHQPVNLNRQ